jgi:hypothetical protein
MGSCTSGEHVEAALIEGSQAKTLMEAINEWQFTGHVHDYEGPMVCCDLCQQKRLRYSFEVRNRLNERRMWVGSGCILHYSFRVVSDGVVLQHALAQRHIKDLMVDMQRKAWLADLVRHSLVSNDHGLTDAVVHYQHTGHFTPQQAAMVFAAFERLKIRYDPSCFKVYMRREVDQEEMRKLEPWKVWRFWSILTPEQRHQASSMGHSAPPYDHAVLSSGDIQA